MAAKYANKHNVPLSVAVWLATDHYDHNDDEWTISVTGLMKPTKQIILAQRVALAASKDAELAKLVLPDISDLVASRMGTAFHDSIEAAWVDGHYKKAMKDLGYAPGLIKQIRINPTRQEVADAKDTRTKILPIYLERRSSKKVGKWTVSGKFDFMGSGRLEDFKSTGTYTFTKQTNGNKYIQQGSLYAWLNQDICTKDVMCIQYIFTDWQVTLSKSSTTNYPKSRTHEQRYKLWTHNETQSYVESKLDALDHYVDKPENEMPMCTDEELWRSEPVWKYYGKADAKRASKVFTSAFDANQHMGAKKKGIVKEIGGEVRACKWCPAAPICKQRQMLIADGSLKV